MVLEHNFNYVVDLDVNAVINDRLQQLEAVGVLVVWRALFIKLLVVVVVWRQ